MAGELGRHGNRPERHQIAVAHRLVQFVGERRHALLQPEQAVRVPVHFGAWRGGHAQQQRVEILEDRPVLLVHAAVGLVDDHQVEMPHAEPADTVPPLVVDAVHHRRVGREHQPAVVLLLFLRQIDRRRVRQVPLEFPLGLRQQRVAVGQEQHAADPVLLHQHVHRGDGQAGLAGPGGHHQQRRPLPIQPVGLHHAADGFVVVRPVDDLLVDRRGGDRLPAGPAVDQQLQFVLLVEPLDLARRVVLIVPHPGLVAVAVEDDRPLARHPLQAVGVQLGLLLAVGWD